MKSLPLLSCTVLSIFFSCSGILANETSVSTITSSITKFCTQYFASMLPTAFNNKASIGEGAGNPGNPDQSNAAVDSLIETDPAGVNFLLNDPEKLPRPGMSNRLSPDEKQAMAICPLSPERKGMIPTENISSEKPGQTFAPQRKFSLFSRNPGNRKPFNKEEALMILLSHRS